MNCLTYSTSLQISASLLTTNSGALQSIMSFSPQITPEMEPSPKPLVALGKIPSVGGIQELLGLGTAPIEVKLAFRDITKDWRISETTEEGQPATELLDWNSAAVRNGLRKLAIDFLAKNDNAERFWSANRPWKYESKLQYPDDRDRSVLCRYLGSIKLDHNR